MINSNYNQALTLDEHQEDFQVSLPKVDIKELLR